MIPLRSKGPRFVELELENLVLKNPGAEEPGSLCKYISNGNFILCGQDAPFQFHFLRHDQISVKCFRIEYLTRKLIQLPYLHILLYVAELIFGFLCCICITRAPLMSSIRALCTLPITLHSQKVILYHIYQRQLV